MTLPADLQALRDDLRPAAARAAALQRRRRRARIAVAAIAAAAVLTGGALAAVRLLGTPAPASVQAQLVPLAQGEFGLPPTASLTARDVAETADATLYGLSDGHGGYCGELVGVARGFLLSQDCGRLYRSRSLSSSLIRIAAVVDGAAPPVVDYGHAPAGTASVRASLVDGTTEQAPLGLERFWLYEPSAGEQDAARRGPIAVEALAADGSVLQRWSFDPPLVLEVSGTPVARVSGRVEIPGARSVQIATLGASSLQTVPVAADGTFTWTTPPGLGRVFAVRAAVLDASGARLSSGWGFEELTIGAFLAQAKGTAPPATTPARAAPTTRAQCAAAWNTSASAALRSAVSGRRTGTVWVDAVPASGGRFVCTVETTASNGGLVVSASFPESSSWTPFRPDTLGQPQGALASVDPRGRLSILGG